MEAILNAFLAYFVIVDPIGTTLIFNALCDGKTIGYRRLMAIRAILLSIGLVVAFGFFGEDLLRILGIEIDAFKVAGGLLIFYSAFAMITQPDRRVGHTDDGEQHDISVFPMSIPLMAGPGSLTLTILLFNRASGDIGDMTYLLIAIGLVYALTLLSLLYAQVIIRLTGQTVNSVMKRLLGVLLASLAVQFIADGVRALMM